MSIEQLFGLERGASPSAETMIALLTGVLIGLVISAVLYERQRRGRR